MVGKGPIKKRGHSKGKSFRRKNERERGADIRKKKGERPVLERKFLKRTIIARTSR